MYGSVLERGPRGQVDNGLGKRTSRGTVTLIAPTDVITRTGETRKIDGVEIEFQIAPDTEAPAEMLMYFPGFKALCGAEDVSHTMHNLYTLRGAEVRDADKWWRALDESLDLFGDRTEVLFMQHHWPRWGKENIAGMIEKQRNAYKFLHDQTLRLANQGLTPNEISERLRLPLSLASEWHLRGYYGTVSHNVKAVYQRYLGWYDGNPANLNPHPPEEAAVRYVEFMGGTETLMAKARKSFDEGDYRWVAEVMKHAVFADPGNMEARELQARAFEQLGYQAESGPWRNVYLTGASELRNGPVKLASTTASPDVLAAMTDQMLLDYMAVKIDADKAQGKVLTINWSQPDSEAAYALTVEDSVLVYKKDKLHERPDVSLTMPRAALAALLSGTADIDSLVSDGKAKIEGNDRSLRDLLSLLDSFELMFNIVTP
jgi:alkyl sulfatase BDS1-like metallo-beta-lactamase superfamily hydrolase